MTVPTRAAHSKSPAALLNPESVRAAALWQLSRSALSVARLRRALLRRAAAADLSDSDGDDSDDNSAAAPEIVMTQYAALVEQTLRRLCDQGLLDDRAYAVMKAASLSRRGYGGWAIRTRLRAHGLDEAAIDDALERTRVDAGADDSHSLDLVAALVWARKRRLGPFRPEAMRAERRARDAAALLRRGFGSAIAWAVLDMSAAEAAARQDRP